MNTAAKGKKFEKEVMDILESEGWLVEQAVNKTVWLGAGRVISVAHDFFGAFDVIGKRLGDPTLWVQVTVWDGVSERRRKLLGGYQWNSDHDAPVIFARVPGRPPHYRLLWGKDGYQWQGETRMVKKKKYGGGS